MLSTKADAPAGGDVEGRVQEIDLQTLDSNLHLFSVNRSTTPSALQEGIRKLTSSVRHHAPVPEVSPLRCSLKTL